MITRAVCLAGVALLFCTSAFAQKPRMPSVVIAPDGRIGVSNGYGAAVLQDGTIAPTVGGIAIPAHPKDNSNPYQRSTRKQDDNDNNDDNNDTGSQAAPASSRPVKPVTYRTSFVLSMSNGESACMSVNHGSDGSVYTGQTDLSMCKKPATHPAFLMTKGYSYCHEIDDDTGGRKFKHRLEASDCSQVIPQSHPVIIWYENSEFGHISGCEMVDNETGGKKYRVVTHVAQCIQFPTEVRLGVRRISDRNIETQCYLVDSETSGQKFRNTVANSNCKKPPTHFALETNPDVPGRLDCYEIDNATNGGKYWVNVEYGGCDEFDPNLKVKNAGSSKSGFASVTEQKIKNLYEWATSWGSSSKARSTSGGGN